MDFSLVSCRWKGGIARGRHVDDAVTGIVVAEEETDRMVCLDDLYSRTTSCDRMS